MYLNVCRGGAMSWGGVRVWLVGWLVGLALVCAFVCLRVCVRVFVSWFVRVCPVVPRIDDLRRGAQTRN